MKKPKEIDAPEWATYLIKDDSGLWYWCENKPTIEDGYISHVGRMEEADNQLLDDDMNKAIKL